jgi:hypothetical protein
MDSTLKRRFGLASTWACFNGPRMLLSEWIGSDPSDNQPNSSEATHLVALPLPLGLLEVRRLLPVDVGRDHWLIGEVEFRPVQPEHAIGALAAVIRQVVEVSRTGVSPLRAVARER